eukprot:1780913-Pyramimonas_sp.AAC.1
MIKKKNLQVFADITKGLSDQLRGLQEMEVKQQAVTDLTKSLKEIQEPTGDPMQLKLMVAELKVIANKCKSIDWTQASEQSFDGLREALGLAIDRAVASILFKIPSDVLARTTRDKENGNKTEYEVMFELVQRDLQILGKCIAVFNTETAKATQVENRYEFGCVVSDMDTLLSLTNNFDIKGALENMAIDNISSIISKQGAHELVHLSQCIVKLRETPT